MLSMKLLGFTNPVRHMTFGFIAWNSSWGFSLHPLAYLYIRQTGSIHLESCLCPLDECVLDIHCPRSSFLPSINSCAKHLSLQLLNAPALCVIRSIHWILKSFFTNSSCLLRLETRLMWAVRVNLTSQSAGNKTKTMKDAEILCRAERNCRLGW